MYSDLLENNQGRKKFSKHYGYITLFPLMFGLIKNETVLYQTLKIIGDNEIL